jgi:hypothetical protein
MRTQLCRFSLFGLRVQRLGCSCVCTAKICCENEKEEEEKISCIVDGDIVCE